MGTDPDIDDFITGNHCWKFENAFGGTETPKHLLFTPSGMTKCPGNPVTADPAASLIITQSPMEPCIWNAVISPFFYQVGFTSTDVAIVFVVGHPWEQAFWAEGVTDSWANENVCPGIPSVQWSGGSAQISWGPGIGP